jgi:adenylyl-sulfate kinase
MSSIDDFLLKTAKKELLRFSTAGSIDDGKSTMIGRLLHDSRNIYDDQLASIRKVSREKASAEQIDFALLTDGLKAEREQGITIDVAYRYFSTPKRKYIIADTPGHEQYTRNMATGASTANLSVVLIDARNGVLPQTRRHAFIASLLGVPRLVVTVNKMDLVDYSEPVFNAIKEEFSAFAAKLGNVDIRFLPISALRGDNVVTRSARMPWYTGESLLELLDSIYIGSDRNLVDLRFPVQRVIRPHPDFRGYAGAVASGILRKGDELLALPSMTTSRVKSIVTYDGDLEEAFPPLSVCVTLEDERDISRGEMLVHRHNLPRVERRFEAMVVWMGDKPMDLNSPYLIKHTTRLTRARIDQVRYKVNVNTLQRSPAEALALNEIGRVVFTSHLPLFCDPYTKNRGTGSFILIDTVNNTTVAAGMIIDREPADQLPSRMAGAADEKVSRARRRESRIAPADRAARYRQKAVTIWLTGLVSCGKIEIAYALERKLFDLGAVCLVLEGESIRHGLSRELDFSSEGLAEHLRRVAETARMLNDSGLIVIGAFVSPTESVRAQAAGIIGQDRYLEVHVDAPIDWCEQHDTAGLYPKAREGKIKNLAGVNMPYEPPAHPHLRISPVQTEADGAAEQILKRLRADGIFPLKE